MSLKSILLFVIVSGVLTYTISFAQVPADLYLFQLHRSADDSYHVYQPKFLSGFNPGGYTNQPWFATNDELLVSVRKADGKQNDIYRLSLTTKKIRQITQTAANEYSPRIHPDGRQLSVLRQVEGDSIDQQIFQTAWPGGGEYKSLTPETRDIGYYAWLSNDELCLFRIEGELNHLGYQNISTNKNRRITSSIGRTLLSDKSGAVIYIHKYADDFWYIKKYYPASSTIDIIVQTPGKVEDFAMTSDGTYFAGMGQKLFSFHPGLDTTWREIADLSIYGISQITRLAISPDGTQLALVSAK